MQFLVFESESEIVDFAVDLVQDVLRRHYMPAIALATGKTPLPLYKRLAELQKEEEIFLNEVQWFALDEFLGEKVPKAATFAHFLKTRFLAKAGLSEVAFHCLNGTAADPEAECVRYERLVKQYGGLKLALLGVGPNGHIAFNEPGTPLGSRTGVRELHRGTRKSNAYLFRTLNAVPTRAVTMGIGTIMESETVVMLATGRSKAGIIHQLKQIEKPTPDLPVSALKQHPDCLVLLDQAANG